MVADQSNTILIWLECTCSYPSRITWWTCSNLLTNGTTMASIGWVIDWWIGVIMILVSMIAEMLAEFDEQCAHKFQSLHLYHQLSIVPPTISYNYPSNIHHVNYHQQRYYHQQSGWYYRPTNLSKLQTFCNCNVCSCNYHHRHRRFGIILQERY